MTSCSTTYGYAHGHAYRDTHRHTHTYGNTNHHPHSHSNARLGKHLDYSNQNSYGIDEPRRAYALRVQQAQPPPPKKIAIHTK